MSSFINLAFFGTSIMQHLEAYAEGMDDQMNLPEIGSRVQITEWRPKGWVHRLGLSLQASRPDVQINIHNKACGGATSRDLCAQIKEEAEKNETYNLTFFSCGLNDIWRLFQGREAESVSLEEYKKNYAEALSLLKSFSNKSICLEETPVAPPEPHAEEINKGILDYNQAAQEIAQQEQVGFIKLFTAFQEAAQKRAASNAPSLWSDGVHLSEHGDETIRQIVEVHTKSLI